MSLFKMFIVPFAADDIENHDHDLKAPPKAPEAPSETRKPTSVQITRHQGAGG
jgi:hypothetical protein